MEDAEQGRVKRVMGLAFLTIFLDLLGFGIIIPVQPFYAESFGASPTQVTLLGGTYSAMQFVFAPVWGRLSDRVGRRPVILASIVASIAGFTLFGLAGSLPALFAARALAGFGNANVGCVQALLADVTSEGQRSRAMGLVGAAFGLGFIFGPAIGGALAQIGPTVPAFASAGFGALNLVLALRLLPETLPPERRGRAGFDHPLAPRALARLMRRDGVGLLLVLMLLTSWAFAQMEQVFALFIEHRFVPEAVLPPGSVPSPQHDAAWKRATALTTWALLLVGVVAAIVQGGLIGRLTPRFGERRLVLAGLLIAALGMAAVAAAGGARSYPALLVGSVLLAAGSGLYGPSLSALLSRSVGGDEQGRTLGIGQSLGSLGRVLGPAVAGALFEWAPHVPFLAGGLGLLGVAAISLRLPRGHAGSVSVS
jgi:MFS family permease